MEITDTIAAKSDQQNAIDFTTGPRTFVVKECRVTGGEQPVSIDLVGEDGRPYKPSKNMRRVVARIWGGKSSEYAGRRLTLYLDPKVTYGGKEVGGIKVSHMSHMDSAITVNITEKRQPVKHTVQPLTEAPTQQQPAPTIADQIDAAIAAFAAGDVTLAQLEVRVGSKRDEWGAGEVAELEALFQSLRSREITKAEAFPEAGESA